MNKHLYSLCVLVNVWGHIWCKRKTHHSLTQLLAANLGLISQCWEWHNSKLVQLDDSMDWIWDFFPVELSVFFFPSSFSHQIPLKTSLYRRMGTALWGYLTTMPQKKSEKLNEIATPFLQKGRTFYFPILKIILLWVFNPLKTFSLFCTGYVQSNWFILPLCPGISWS